MLKARGGMGLMSTMLYILCSELVKGGGVKNAQNLVDLDSLRISP